MDTAPPPVQPQYTEEEVVKRIENMPRLASLRSINTALSDLVKAEHEVSTQIAEIIRRDASLTSRLLKLVNSVFFGLSQTVNSIEEAVFYLGLKQIRELAVATPVIEDMEAVTGIITEENWKEIWQHSIGTAILTREILSLADAVYDDDTDYIIGLVHNIGKLIIASTFPEVFKEIVEFQAKDPLEICKLEQKYLTWDHAQIGAYYLEKHKLSEEIVEATRYHHRPENAEQYAQSSAAVQVANAMARSVGIYGLESIENVEPENWNELSGWKILFGEDNDPIIQASLQYSLRRLPHVLEGMI